MEWIEVVDSAVKIGLGALISGGATYAVARLNHAKAVTKDITARKITMLNEAAELAEPYFFYFTRLQNKVIGMARTSPNVGNRLSQRQLEMLEEMDLGLTDALAKRNQAMSKVLLLQLPSAEKALVAYNVAISEFRVIVFEQKMLPMLDRAGEFSVRFNLHKHEFYKALSDGLNALK